MSRHDAWASYLDPDSADGESLPASEQAALDKIRGVLAEPSTWSDPPDDLTARVLAAASADTADLADDPELAAELAAGDPPDPADDPQLAAGDPAGVVDDPQLAAGDPAGVVDDPPLAAGDAADLIDDPELVAESAGADPADTAAAAGAAELAVPDTGTADFDRPAEDGTAPAVAAQTAPVVPLAPRRRRRWLVAAGSAVAAAVAAVLAIGFWPTGSPTQYPVAGTAIEPAANAMVTVDPRPAGVAITVTISGLPPSTDDTYYAVWLRGDPGTVPVGSFHWRKSGEPIDLWSGVDPARYPTFFVTRQHEGAPPTPSPETVLQGTLRS